MFKRETRAFYFNLTDFISIRLTDFEFVKRLLAPQLPKMLELGDKFCMELTLAITGASGIIYAHRTLQLLAESGVVSQIKFDNVGDCRHRCPS